MRYAVISKGTTLEEVVVRCKSVGARRIKPKPAMKQLFCDLDREQAAKLSKMPGLKVKEVAKVTGGVVAPAPTSITTPLQTGLNLYTIYGEMRALYTPALNGVGLTVAVLDSGVRETHEALVGKVVRTANFSDEPNANDIFGHGTGVAYIIAGEGIDGKSGVAPGAKIMNMKVLNNNGEGTDEMVVDAIDEVCALVTQAKAGALPLTDPMYPNTINLSIGSEDDGDPDNPMRVACRAAIEDYGVEVVAAAGNSGPDLTTIMCPATDPLVVAVGGLKTWEFTIWELSSRGPTEGGAIKPDLVCWSENIEVASHGADDEYEVKSGTSFSTPILVGVDGILWDLTRRVYGGQIRITYSDWLQYAYAYCLKPEEAPAAKDNTYGYGIPAMGSMVKQLTRPAAPLTGILEMLPMLMMMGILPGLMGGMAGGT